MRWRNPGQYVHWTGKPAQSHLVCTKASGAPASCKLLMAPHTFGISPRAWFLRSLLARHPSLTPPAERGNPLARHDEIGNRKISAASNPAEPAHSINGYRYRSDSKPAPHSEGLDELKLRLRQHRRLLAFKSTSIRAGTALLNRHLALALVDGVSMRAVAGAARLSHKEVRQACQAFDDLPPSGFTAAVHLQSISSIEKELAALRQSKAAVEAARLNLMATTRRRGRHGRLRAGTLDRAQA